MIATDLLSRWWVVALEWMILLTLIYGPVILDLQRQRWRRRHTTWPELLERSERRDGHHGT